MELTEDSQDYGPGPGKRKREKDYPHYRNLSAKQTGETAIVQESEAFVPLIAAARLITAASELLDIKQEIQGNFKQTLLLIFIKH